jgi:hypothetical protein
MRRAVTALAVLGPLPSEQSADPKALESYETLIRAIESPITDEEARTLAGLFGADGADSCFGVAWSLLHLIETAPGWPIAECLQDTENGWIDLLKQRLENYRRMTRKVPSAR